MKLRKIFKIFMRIEKMERNPIPIEKKTIKTVRIKRIRNFQI